MAKELVLARLLGRGSTLANMTSKARAVFGHLTGTRAAVFCLASVCHATCCNMLHACFVGHALVLHGMGCHNGH